jgi:hypothetical protein
VQIRDTSLGMPTHRLPLHWEESSCSEVSTSN